LAFTEHIYTALLFGYHRIVANYPSTPIALEPQCRAMQLENGKDGSPWRMPDCLGLAPISPRITKVDFAVADLESISVQLFAMTTKKRGIDLVFQQLVIIRRDDCDASCFCE